MLKWLYRISLGVCVIILMFRLADWACRRGPALPPPPKPNGYEQIVIAARDIKPLPHDFENLSSTQIQQFARQNFPSIEKMRAAFPLDSSVTVEVKKDWQDRHEEDLSNLKRLAVALGLEAKIQLINGQTNNAARCEVDSICLAQRVNKGGILLDGITGLGMEIISSASLQSLLSQMDASACRDAASRLEEIQSKREKPETIIATQKAWSARRFGLIDYIGSILTRKSDAKRYAQFIERSHESAGRTQRVMLRLAARAYELDHHKPPANISDLIPVYLKSVPINPENGKEVPAIPPPLN